jgi:hypothetical protein
MVVLSTLLALLAAPPPPPAPAAAVESAAEDWRFVLPAPGDPFEHPPLRAIRLARTCPEDVREMVQYRGVRRRYAQIRYGSPSSVRVTVVLDEVGPGEDDLYVDAGRNRRIEPGDRVKGEVEGRSQTWRLPLRVSLVEGEETRYLERAMVFRRGASGLTFSTASAGYLEGRVRVGDRSVRARRMDGDGNGSLTDAQDRLWIDLDDDGRFDPATEQFLHSPVLALDGARYAVRSDEFGARLALERLEGSGTVRLELRTPGLAARVADIEATLIGRDGSAVGVRGLDAPATVPIGEYRLGTVTIALNDPDGGPRWSFVFSDDDARARTNWHAVARDAAIALDPIGTPAMEARVDAPPGGHRAGDVLEVQPRLCTGDGLLINSAARGEQASAASDGGPSARVMVSCRGRAVGEPATSGFA